MAGCWPAPTSRAPPAGLTGGPAGSSIGGHGEDLSRRAAGLRQTGRTRIARISLPPAHRRGGALRPGPGAARPAGRRSGRRRPLRGHRDDADGRRAGHRHRAGADRPALPAGHARAGRPRLPPGRREADDGRPGAGRRAAGARRGTRHPNRRAPPGQLAARARRGQAGAGRGAHRRAAARHLQRQGLLRRLRADEHGHAHAQRAAGRDRAVPAGDR